MSSCGIPGCGGPARLYPVGDRCDPHSPAALSGVPIVVPDPAATLNGLRNAAGIQWSYLPTTSALNDDRAIKSGKRRSNPVQYQAARAAEEARRIR